MFTGIIESLGEVKELKREGTNLRLTIEAPIAQELRVDQSVAHSGVCLTVEKLLTGSRYEVVAVAETLERSNLGSLVQGSQVNLERCLRADSRLDGHFVQGHVDSTTKVTSVGDEGGSWRLSFTLPREYAALAVEKGSIAINGVSLTVADLSSELFSIVIIPYTYDHTNLGTLKPGDRVNLEFDILGKYIQRALGLQATRTYHH